jgi:predicted MFS family arabinose efflux permease
LNLSEIKFPKAATSLSKKSRKVIIKLSGLFAIDAFAGGLITTTIVTLWFSERFSASLNFISTIFFIAGLLETISYLGSNWLAQRIGLVRTMVFTHLPSNLLLVLVPFMPTLELATLFYISRYLLSQMDVPARQSYIVAVVHPEEKATATATTNATRMLASSAGPSIASVAFSFPAFSPFLLCGALKIVYDLALYLNFRIISLPEEAAFKKEKQFDKEIQRSNSS